jgi:beta-glucosidase
MNHQLDESAASLMAFLPGSEGGAAIGEALFGKMNPSGRLPVSWPKASSQLPLAYNEPGKPYDPRYPFGYGLSYTRFDVGRASVHGDRASVTVRNIGNRAGDRTVLAFDGQRLVGFTRVHLDAGAKTKAWLTIAPGSSGVVVR